MKLQHLGLVYDLVNRISAKVYCRNENLGITVDDLSDDSRPIPNPVTTFPEAFQHYRKL